MRLSRRTFLRATAAAGGAIALACRPSDDTDTEPPPDTDLPPAPEATLVKAPWLCVAGPNSLRLRFETREDLDLPVILTIDDGEPDEQVPTRSSYELTYENVVVREDLLADEPGVHVLHDLVLTDLPAGVTLGWTLRLASGTHTGTVRTPPAPDATIRVAWISDSMWPTAAATAQRMADEAPDLVLHGGDLQYRSNPFDTWNGLFQALTPLTTRAPFHAAVGNHEDEKAGELVEMYERLFGPQGEPGSGPRHHAFSYGPLRVVMLDSETGSLGDPENPELVWLNQQLAAADADDDVKVVIVAWHRPVVTFSDYYSEATTVEDQIVPRLIGTKARLVMCGHAHAFEHFYWRNVHFVVDGTAGSFLYDPDFALETATANRPDLVAARTYVDAAWGGSILEIDGTGAITLRRIHNTEAEEVWRVVIPVPT